MRDDFVQLVADMRAAQKRYFKTRTQMSLAESKRLEGLVDQAIKDGEVPEGHGYKQSTLFGGENQGPYGKGA